MPKKPTLVHLDPEAVEVHPDNVRRDLGDLRPLIRSVKEVGVLVPLIVVPTDDGGHMVVAGHRRRAAAIEAERQVPCIVRHDLVGQVDQIASMLVENVHREPLSAAEEAAACEQLALLGLSNTAIARATGMSRQHVAKARTVAGSDVASTVADRYALTLDQAIVLAEFEDDSEAVKSLTVTARKDPARFPHVASRLRQDRERATERALLVEALTAEGVTVLHHVADRPEATSLRDLTDAEDGTPISPEAHAHCPGRAAVLDDWQPNGVRYYCLDPSANGHRSRHNASGRPKPTPMSDEAKAERREVTENNRAWRAAEPVRREYVRALLGRKTPPKGTLRYVTEAIAGEPDRVGDGKEALLAELVGVESTGHRRSIGAALVADATDARLPLVLLAQVATDCEQRMDVYVWRHPRTYPEAGRYLAYLASTGYGLSEIEQRVVDEVMADAEATDAHPDVSGEALDDDEEEAA